MLDSELFYAVWRKISLESGSSNMELVDHIANERVVLGIFEYSLGVFHGLFIHGLWSATATTTFIRIL